MTSLTGISGIRPRSGLIRSSLVNPAVRLDQPVKESDGEITLCIVITAQVDLWILAVVGSFTAVYFLIYFIKYLALFIAVLFPDLLRNSEVAG